LITLMIDVRRSAATDSIQKDHLLPNPSGLSEGNLTVQEHACRTHPIDGSLEPCWSLGDCISQLSDMFPLHDFKAKRLPAHAQ
jgi:hypothetical protein